MMIRAILAVVLTLAASLAVAEAPLGSLRPVARMAPPSASPAFPSSAAAVVALVSVPGPATIRPRLRPYFDVQVTRYAGLAHQPYPTQRPSHPLDVYSIVPAAVIAPASPDAPHPEARPKAIEALFGLGKKQPAKGSVCGVRAIRGTTMKPIGNPSRGCGIANPVRVTEVAGVRLSTPATIDCPTAKALNTWVEKGLKPALKRKGGGVAELKIAAHYACRTRNNVPGGKLSEHARGHAVDISGFRLKDGTTITVLQHWRSKKYGTAMKTAHRSACGPFGTVLGPKANKYHQDHFHFDTARYRSGAYCR
jgi:hypothetical protein